MEGWMIVAIIIMRLLFLNLLILVWYVYCWKQTDVLLNQPIESSGFAAALKAKSKSKNKSKSNSKSKSMNFRQAMVGQSDALGTPSDLVLKNVGSTGFVLEPKKVDEDKQDSDSLETLEGQKHKKKKPIISRFRSQLKLDLKSNQITLPKAAIIEPKNIQNQPKDLQFPSIEKKLSQTAAEKPEQVPIGTRDATELKKDPAVETSPDGSETPARGEEAVEEEQNRLSEFRVSSKPLVKQTRQGPTVAEIRKLLAGKGQQEPGLGTSPSRLNRGSERDPEKTPEKVQPQKFDDILRAINKPYPKEGEKSKEKSISKKAKKKESKKKPFKLEDENDKYKNMRALINKSSKTDTDAKPKSSSLGPKKISNAETKSTSSQTEKVPKDDNQRSEQAQQNQKIICDIWGIDDPATVTPKTSEPIAPKTNEPVTITSKPITEGQLVSDQEISTALDEAQSEQDQEINQTMSGISEQEFKLQTMSDFYSLGTTSKESETKLTKEEKPVVADVTSKTPSSSSSTQISNRYLPKKGQEMSNGSDGPKSSPVPNTLDSPRISPSPTTPDRPKRTLTLTVPDRPKSSLGPTALDKPKSSIASTTLDKPKSSIASITLDKPKSSLPPTALPSGKPSEEPQSSNKQPK